MTIQNFDNTSVDVQTLKPFKKFIMSIGELPTNYIDSLSYAELLTWFCDYLQNKVIPVVNNNAEAIIELQNFFNNLDLQDEIDKKLDEMAEDGTLEKIISEYFNELNERIDNLEIETNTKFGNLEQNVNTSLGIQDSKIEALQSNNPVPVSSIEDMTDHDTIYVNTTNGKWYYYNGTEFVIGGDFQSSQIGDGEVNRQNLNMALWSKLLINNRQHYDGITITRDTEHITVKTTHQLFLLYMNNFITIPAQELVINTTSALTYLCIKNDTNKSFEFISNNDFQLIDKSNYYVLGCIFTDCFINLLDNNLIKAIGFRTPNVNKNIIIYKENSYINVDNTNLSFNNLFLVKTNGTYSSIANTSVSIPNVNGIYLICLEESNILLYEPNSYYCNYENVIGFYYNGEVKIFNVENNKIIGSKCNNNAFTIIRGSINYDVSNSKWIISDDFYAIVPSLNKTSNTLYSSNETIEINNSGNTNTLCFNPKTLTFELKTFVTFLKSNGLIPIATLFNNEIYPYIEAKNLKLNGIPYYNSVINVNTNGAITNTIDGVISDITDKTNTTKIVLVGDSICAGAGGTNYSADGDIIFENEQYTWRRNDNGYCWANLLKNYLETNYNVEVINNALYGTRVELLASNINTLVPTDTDILIINYGTNSRGSSDNYNDVFNTMAQSYNTIISYCETNNIKYIINTPCPSSSIDETNRYIHIYHIVNIINKIASVHNSEFINLYNLIYYWCLEKNINWDTYISNDNVHPNDKGHWLMFYLTLKGLNLAPNYIQVTFPE